MINERLTEYHCGVAVIKDKSKLREAMEKLAHYEDLEEQGLLIKLPCKVGDTLYYIDDDEIYHDKVYSIDVREVNGEHIFGVCCMDWKYDDFGKTVFLTKKEAEAELQRLKGKSNE